MRQNTFSLLRYFMPDVETQLTEKMQDDFERLEFMHSMAMGATAINAQEVEFVLLINGYDPRPDKPQISEQAREEIEELTGNTSYVKPVEPKKKGWPKGKPRGRRTVKVNGKSSSDVYEPSV